MDAVFQEYCRKLSVSSAMSSTVVGKAKELFRRSRSMSMVSLGQVTRKHWDTSIMRTTDRQYTYICILIATS